MKLVRPALNTFFGSYFRQSVGGVDLECTWRTTYTPVDNDYMNDKYRQMVVNTGYRLSRVRRFPK